MIKIKKVIIFAYIFLFFLSSLVFSDENSKFITYKRLVPGEALEEVLVPDASGTSFQTYVFDVEEDTFGVRIFLEKSQADLDLFILEGREITSYSDADYISARDVWNESLTLSRFSDPPLRTGTYYLDVAYQFTEPPVLEGKPLEGIKYTLLYELISAQAERRIPANSPAKITLLPEKGMFEVFEIEVPASATALRVDLFDARGDLDLYISRGKPAVERSQALYVSDTLVGRENLVITRGSRYPLEPGIYYVSVFDQSPVNFGDEVSVLVSYGEKAPEQLLVIPQFPFARDSIENALLATVEIIGDSSKGSGCLVSPAGHILTNYHVIKSNNGLQVRDVVVAVNLNSENPAVELFRAELIAFDEKRDIALLQVKKGFYNQPLPFRYRFPFFPLGNPKELVIGQPLGFLGFPGLGGTGSRASITYSQGVVGGFERNSLVSFIKTDGIIHDGSSGGAAINSYGELIGIPTLFVGEGTSQIGFIASLEVIPREWVNQINSAK